MGAKKYTRTSDTGLRFEVSRSLEYEPSLTLVGGPSVSQAITLATSFTRSYQDTNYTRPTGVVGSVEKNYNRAGNYFIPRSTTAISSFMTIFGNNPEVPVPRIDATGFYDTTPGGSLSVLDSRLSHDVFGDPMFYKSEPNLLATIPSDTSDSEDFVLYNDERFVVAAAGTNKEFFGSGTLSRITDAVTGIEAGHSHLFTISASVHQAFPSDGLAFPDGGHPYRSLFADTRAASEAEQLFAIIGSAGNNFFCRGLPALGLLPKTEVYEIPIGTADWTQYPSRNVDGSASYSPRLKDGKFLPATSDPDLRGFHGQFWVSSTPFDNTDNTVQGRFTKGLSNVPIAFSVRPGRDAYTADSVRGVLALDGAGDQNDSMVPTTVGVNPVTLKAIIEPRFVATELVPNVRGTQSLDLDMVQDYRSVLMRTLYHSKSQGYPFTAAAFPQNPLPMTRRLSTLWNQIYFAAQKFGYDSGAAEFRHTAVNDAYPYVRHLLANTAKDARTINEAAFGWTEVAQPKPQEASIIPNIQNYRDPGLMPQAQKKGVLPVKLDFNDATQVAIFEAIEDLSPMVVPSNENTYDFSSYSIADYETYLGYINVGMQGSFDHIGATTRMAMNDMLFVISALPQKTINKLRFATNTVSRIRFGAGDNIVLTPDTEASFGVMSATFANGGTTGEADSFTYRCTIEPGIFDRFNTSLPARPETVHIGDPIRIYFADNPSQTSLPPISTRYGVITVFPSDLSIPADITDVVLNTSLGPISLKRDVGLTELEFRALASFDLNDDRLTPTTEVNNDGLSIILRSTPTLRPQVTSIDIISTKPESIGIRIKNIVLHHLQEATFKHEYFNNVGHVAHSMDRDPMSTVRFGTRGSPVRDPGFLQSEGSTISAFGYQLDGDTRATVEQVGVANIDIQVYNPMFGVPRINQSRGDIINSIYNFNTSRDLIYRRAQIPFMRQGFVYNEEVTIVNSEAQANLPELGFGQDGLVPRQGYDTERFTDMTDVFGRAKIFGVPTSENPVFDSNGRIGLIFGGPIKIHLPKNNGTQVPGHPYPYDDTLSDEITMQALRLSENSRNPRFVLKSDVYPGLLPVDQDKMGVAFRSILAQTDPILLERFNRDEFTVDPSVNRAGGVFMDMTRAPAVYDSHGTPPEFDSFGTIFPNPLLFTHIPSTTTFIDSEGDEYMVDSDNGVIDFGATNGTTTTNLLHPRNSKVNENYNGVFYWGAASPQEIMFNYLYPEVKPGSRLRVEYPGFFAKGISTADLGVTDTNKLGVVREPLIPIRNRGAQFGVANSAIRIAPAAYTISDQGVRDAVSAAIFGAATDASTANQGSISSQAGFSVSQFTLKSLADATVNERFLNFPIHTARNEAYLNHRFNQALDASTTTTPAAGGDYHWNELFTDYRFGIGPKAVSYALGPADLFFGTATTLEGAQRQVTKHINFGIELSKYQDTMETAAEPNSSTYPNYRVANPTVTSVLPPGTYTFICHIQDMMIPQGVKEGESPDVFTPTDENGLRSNFYWNIPSTVINEGLFATPPTVTITDGSISAVGSVLGTTASTQTDVSGNLNISIRPADSFSINPLDESIADVYGGGDPTCEKGVLFPDPMNRDHGREGMNPDGSAGEKGSDGQYRQSYKTIRIDMYCDQAFHWPGLQNVAKLAVSFRPNTTIPQEFLESLSVDGETASRYELYGEGQTNIDIPRGEFPCFARIGTLGFFHSLFGRMVNPAFTRGPIYIDSMPGDSLDHLPEKRDRLSTTEPGRLAFRSVAAVASGDDVVFYTDRTVLGYHQVLAPAEDSARPGFSSYKSLVGRTPEELSTELRQVNRSILDQTEGLNIVNLGGMATKGVLTLSRSVLSLASGGDS